MARKEFPKRIRDAVAIRANGHCEKCKAVLKSGEGECDHILPDGLGGKPELANAMWLCKVCHTEKTTKQDTPTMRKADRQRKVHMGVTKPKGKIQSAPFAKSGKTPKIDKSALPPLPRRSLFG